MELMKFRMKPNPVEAVKVTVPMLEVAAIWCGGQVREQAKPSDHTDIAYWIDVPTLTGPVRASMGEYIIKDADGRFRVLTATLFEQIYEPESDTP